MNVSTLKNDTDYLSLENYNKIFSNEKRLDASFYCNEDNLILNEFQKSSLKKEKLIDFLNLSERNWKNSIYLPNRSSRVYVDKEYGIPYFSGSDITMNYPKASAYLSKNHKSVESTRIPENCILIAARGTIGKCIHVNDKIKGSCASDNIIRVISKSSLSGFLYVFFKSKYGQVQFNRDTYGSVVDAISSQQVGNILIPKLKDDFIRNLDQKIKKVFKIKDNACELLDKSLDLFYKELKLEKNINFRNNKNYSTEFQLGFEDRLDASFYDEKSKKIIKILEKSNFDIKKIGNKSISSDIFMPNRFKRNFVKEEFGKVFLSGKNILQVDSADRKYLKPDKKLSNYLIKENYILITRSGTIGKAIIVPKDWHNYYATEHIIRIVPKYINPGYLYTFFESVYGKVQLEKYIFGSIVDHISEDQIAEMLIPIVSKKIENKIGELSCEAYNMFSLANKKEAEIIDELEKKIH